MKVLRWKCLHHELAKSRWENKMEKVRMTIFNYFSYSGNIWNKMIKKNINKWDEKLLWLSIRIILKEINEFGIKN